MPSLNKVEGCVWPAARASIGGVVTSGAVLEHVAGWRPAKEPHCQVHLGVRPGSMSPAASRKVAQRALQALLRKGFGSPRCVKPPLVWVAGGSAHLPREHHRGMLAGTIFLYQMSQLHWNCLWFPPAYVPTGYAVGPAPLPAKLATQSSRVATTCHYPHG